MCNLAKSFILALLLVMSVFASWTGDISMENTENGVEALNNAFLNWETELGQVSYLSFAISSASENVEASSSNALNSSSLDIGVNEVANDEIASIDDFDPLEGIVPSAKVSRGNFFDRILEDSESPQFAVNVAGRLLKISEVKVGSMLKIFDAQGHLLLRRRIVFNNTNFSVPYSGSFVVKVNAQAMQINVD